MLHSSDGEDLEIGIAFEEGVDDGPALLSGGADDENGSGHGEGGKGCCGRGIFGGLKELGQLELSIAEGPW